MKILDLTLSSPAENLALDEALLDACEEGGPETLRFWESETVFAVLGYSNKYAEEIRQDTGEIPVLRRVSGGGTVLQGPGCLNYSLILHARAPLDTVTGANQAVMAKMRAALAKHLRRPVASEGCTDLAIDGLKFSGNAQRRKRTALLFHGTFLLNFNFELIERHLLPPPRQPEYRQNRSHRDFLMNLEEDAGTIKSIVTDAWSVGARRASPLQTKIPREAVRRLVEEKYSKDEWNLRM